MLTGQARDNVKRDLGNLFEQQVFPLFFLAAVFGLNLALTNQTSFAALSLLLLKVIHALVVVISRGLCC